MVTCVKLADPQIIISSSNLNSLLLDTYERSEGTTVSITCLVSTGFELVGRNTLTCQSSGQWDGDTPKCVLKSSLDPTDINGIEIDMSVDAFKSNDLSMVPWIVSFTLFAILLMSVIVCFVYALYRRRQQNQLETASSEHGEPGTQLSYMDRWNSKQSLSSPYRSYEGPDGSMTDSQRYVTLQDQWDTVTVIS